MWAYLFIEHRVQYIKRIWKRTIFRLYLDLLERGERCQVVKSFIKGTHQIGLHELPKEFYRLCFNTKPKRIEWNRNYRFDEKPYCSRFISNASIIKEIIQKYMKKVER